MFRTVGLCVIVISGVGCGFAMSNELGRRKDDGNDLTDDHPPKRRNTLWK